MSEKSFFKLKTVEEALAICREIARIAKMPMEMVPVDDAVGRVAAVDVISPENVPGFARSTMDGYAVRAESTFAATTDSPVTLKVVGRVPMGRPPDFTISAGEAASVGTGGMMPEGVDATIMLEHVDMLDRQTIVVSKPVAPGENVIRADEDLAAGAACIEAGTRISPRHVALLAAAGIRELDVARRVKVGVISTGDEIVPAHKTPGPGQVRDINTHALIGLIRQVGARANFYGIVPDEKESMLQATRQAAADNDVVLISGGSSVGVRDLTVQVLQEMGEPGVLVHGVQMKPGKPTIIARADRKVFLGVPGHPTSSMVCFHVFIAPLLGWMSGCEEQPLPVYARASRNIPTEEGKTEFIRGRLTERDGELWAEPIFSKSGLVSTIARANALIEVPAGVEGIYEGDLVRVRLL